MAAVPPIFALTPAVAVQGVIDYNTNEGRKLYSSATHKLDEELYDCKPEGLYQFLQSLNNRAQEYGWNDDIGGILHIPEDVTDPYSDTNYLIDTYGVISLEQIRKWEESYLNLPIRPAQDAFMMFKCLMNSISKEGKLKILIWKNQYTVGALSSGNLLLKVIIRESHLDTNATVASIRTKLSDLDTYILTIGSNITHFNGYVRLLIDSLAARGHTTQDLLTNLFKGYQAASDKVFVDYIARKLERYEEGEDITSDELMRLGDNKFKLLTEGGLWNAPSVEEEKILALQAEIKNLKTKVSKNPFKKEKDKVFGKKDEKSKYKDKFKTKQMEKPSWFFKEPSEDEMRKPKTWNDKTWYYCSAKTGGKCSGQYRRHKPSDCEGKAHTFTRDKKTKPDSEKTDRKIKLDKAYESIIERKLQDDSEENSE